MGFELPHLLKSPRIPDTCYVDPSARINGDVRLGENCSIWFHAAIRGDVNSIEVGDRTNIQDGCILHTLHDRFDLRVGDDVTFGHGAIAHGCTIGSRVLLGMRSLVLDGAVIGGDVIVGAGSLVPPGKRIPSGVLLMGQPARIVRDLTEEEIRSIPEQAIRYTRYVEAYRKAGQFHGFRDHNDFVPEATDPGHQSD